MNFSAVQVFFLVIGAFALISLVMYLPGMLLHRSVTRMGSCEGKTKGQVFDALGFPTAKNVNGDGTVTLQWIATGYHVALIFRDETCLGMSYEYTVFSWVPWWI